MFEDHVQCSICNKYFTPDLTINGICKQCLKATQIKDNELRLEEERKASRLKELAIHIPKRYIDNTFESFEITPDNKQAFAIVKKYAESDIVKNNGNNLVLSGSVGTGKTMLAMCVLRHRFLQFDNICYTTISELIMKSRQSMSYGGNTNLMSDYYTADYLAIDEIGRQSGSDNELNLLFEILNKRYNNVLPTILITNKSGKDIQKFLGTAIVDRMNEVNTMFLDMSWESYRLNS